MMGLNGFKFMDEVRVANLRRWGIFKVLSLLTILMLVSCNIGNAQTATRILLNLQDSIGKEDLLEKYIRALGNGFATCIPVFVSSDSYKGYAIISGDDLFYYYRDEYLDSVQSRNFSNEDYYAFAKNLLLQKDTIKLAFKKYQHNWFKAFQIVDSIMNYSYDKKQELIDLAFENDGSMKESNLKPIYQLGSIVLKLFEWGIFMMDWDAPPYYRLFDIGFE